MFDGLPAARIDAYVERFSQPGALTAALNWYRAMRRPTNSGPITTPTLYVWSTGDAFIGETAARGVAEHVDGPYRFEVLEGVSHWISEQAPERLSALLLDHLGAY
jgi:pimeloyl-ACP methyl ester carboxylesterase